MVKKRLAALGLSAAMVMSPMAPMMSMAYAEETTTTEADAIGEETTEDGANTDKEEVSFSIESVQLYADGEDATNVSTIENCARNTVVIKLSGEKMPEGPSKYSEIEEYKGKDVYAWIIKDKNNTTVKNSFIWKSKNKNGDFYGAFTFNKEQGGSVAKTEQLPGKYTAQLMKLTINDDWSNTDDKDWQMVTAQTEYGDAYSFEIEEGSFYEDIYVKKIIAEIQDYEKYKDVKDAAEKTPAEVAKEQAEKLEEKNDEEIKAEETKEEVKKAITEAVNASKENLEKVKGEAITELTTGIKDYEIYKKVQGVIDAVKAAEGNINAAETVKAVETAKTEGTKAIKDVIAEKADDEIYEIVGTYEKGEPKDKNTIVFDRESGELRPLLSVPETDLDNGTIEAFGKTLKIEYDESADAVTVDESVIKLKKDTDLPDLVEALENILGEEYTVNCTGAGAQAGKNITITGAGLTQENATIIVKMAEDESEGEDTGGGSTGGGGAITPTPDPEDPEEPETPVDPEEPEVTIPEDEKYAVEGDNLYTTVDGKVQAVEGKKFVRIGTDWYMTRPNGTVAKDCMRKWTDGEWYLFRPDGTMVADKMRRYKDHWFLMRPDGTMVANKMRRYKNHWFMFDANGYMLANTTRTYKGVTYTIDANGYCHW